MEKEKFKREVLAPALQTIAAQVMGLAENIEQHSATSSKYLRLAAGYLLLAQQEMWR